MAVAPTDFLVTVDECGRSPFAFDPVLQSDDKLAGYFSLLGVMHYLILNPATRRGVHHQRGQGDLIETRLLLEGALLLDPPGIIVEA